MTDSLPNTTTPTEEAEAYRIPECRMGALEKKVEKFGRRAAKLGLPAITFTVVGEDIVDEKVWSEARNRWVKTGRKLVFKLVEVNGEAPVVAGHTFVARIEHTEAGSILSKAPGTREVEVPTSLRDGAATCDHCNTRRHRNDTFIIRHDESGDLKRIGRNCLADYIRDTDAAKALSIWTLLHDIRTAAIGDDEEPGGFGGGGFSYHGTADFLAHVSRSIELHGWTSKGAAYENEGLIATANEVLDGLDEPPKKDADRAAWVEAQPLAHNTTEAEETLAWVTTLDDAKDYEHNLMVSCSLGYVKPKNHGLVASAVAGYRRHKERELYKAREAKKAAESPSEHFGTVKSRYLRKLTVTKTNSWDTEYGTTFLYNMEDEAGNSFKWFASNGCWFKFEGEEDRRGLDVGDTLYFVFAVKDHGEWNGAKETTITRAKPSETPPTIKWLDEATGEIFKTKKALKAAA